MEMRQCPDAFVEHNSAMVEGFLGLGCGLVSLMGSLKRFSSHIDRVQRRRESREVQRAQFVRSRRLKDFDSLWKILVANRGLSVNGWNVVELYKCGLR